MSFGIFEGLEAQAGNNSARNQRLVEAKSLDTAVFRAREQFGDYLANAKDQRDLQDRIAHIRPKLLKVVAEVTPPIPKVMRQVVAALKASLGTSGRPRQAGMVSPDKNMNITPWAQGESFPDGSRSPRKQIPSKKPPGKPMSQMQSLSSVRKVGWSYDHSTKLYTHVGSFKAFTCPGCQTPQDHLGLNFCKCGRTFNSWVVRNASSSTKTGSPSDTLMCREVKMRGDQFRLAKTAGEEESSDSAPDSCPCAGQPNCACDPNCPNCGDNSSPAPGESRPMPPQMQTVQPGMPGSGPSTPMDPDGDMDVPGTEGGPLDQVADALAQAVQGIRAVQELAIGDPRSVTAAKNLEKAMNKYWALEQRRLAAASARAKKIAAAANQALKKARQTRSSVEEAEFLRGWDHASANKPLPPRTSSVWLEGYIAFSSQTERNRALVGRSIPTLRSSRESTKMNPVRTRKRSDTYDDGADTSSNYQEPQGDSAGLPVPGSDWTGGGETDGPTDAYGAGQGGGTDYRDKLEQAIDEDNARPRDPGTINSVPKSGARRLPKGQQAQRNASIAARLQPKR